ncbi:MAG: hypothetical protein HY269_02305 [Deltaproteobacteria bacterium]|nr:hypothetical protein [Deltaproteobacteria bacterium]
MTIDGFLTFLTIVIAAYAVMPSVTRLRIELRRFWMGTISIIGLLLALYFLLPKLSHQLCLYMFPQVYCQTIAIPPGSSIDNGQAAFIVVITWMILAGTATIRSKLSPRSIPTLSRLASLLHHEKKYPELVQLLGEQLRMLEQASTRQITTAKLHDYLKSFDARQMSLFESLRAG